MTTYNTGSPIGSTDPRDLFDNAENLDGAVNSTTSNTWIDRLGVTRKTWHGMESEHKADQYRRENEFQASQDNRENEFQASQDNREGVFNAYLVSAGYQFVGDYAAGIEITQYNQVVRDTNGEFWRLSGSTELPYTTTGAGMPEGGAFVSVGDAVLRQDLLASGGAALVGYGSGKVSDELDRLVLRDINPVRYGAVGNGTADDTAAFNALESAITGRVVDLGGRTYLVTSRPLKNTYTNGKFKYSGATRPAQESEGFTIPFGRFKNYGQQLEKLKSSLCNPFEQFTGIVFIGDSITWGATLPENLSPGSDLTTLATRRDVFLSPSFVNEFKRYIGKEYFDNEAPAISNWAASTAGEAIAEYTKTAPLYPNRNPFSYTTSGSANVKEVGHGAEFLLGYQMVLAAASGGVVELTMPNFTGEKFTLVFSCVDGDSMPYEVLVNDVSIGTFGTGVAAGFSDQSYGNRINHSFSYVRNGTVKIRFENSGLSPTRRLRIEAIEVPKTVRITNQGISGSNSTRYRTRALETGHLPDIAVTGKDNYCFVQLGTNDRGLDATWPNGLNAFKDQMAQILDILDPLCDSILMCANHVGASNQIGKNFTMQQIRGALASLASDRQHDFIDNYAIFTWADPSVTLADGLHPNALGHQMIYRNIIEALEHA